MYVCMYVRMYVRMYVHMYVCTDLIEAHVYVAPLADSSRKWLRALGEAAVCFDPRALSTAQNPFPFSFSIAHSLPAWIYKCVFVATREGSCFRGVAFFSACDHYRINFHCNRGLEYFHQSLNQLHSMVTNVVLLKHNAVFIRLMKSSRCINHYL